MPAFARNLVAIALGLVFAALALAVWTAIGDDRRAPPNPPIAVSEFEGPLHTV